MSRRSASEPPRHAHPQEPTTRLLPLIALPAVLALFGLGGYLLQLATPSPAQRTAADLRVTSQESGGAGAARPGTVQTGSGSTASPRFLPGVRLSKRPEPRIPHHYVKVSKTLAEPTSFNVVSFNTLGFSHTSKGGDRKGWRPGGTRMREVVGILRNQDASVVGFQEFQGPQFATFHAMAPDYAVYPGRSLGNQPLQNSIAWRTTDWELVKAQTTPIPYFYNRVPMPQVLLRNLHTGREVWFGNFHNPADKFHPAQGARNAATAIEAALVRGFVGDGYPVILTGDMNERDSFYCRISGLAPLHGADGSYRDAAGCHTTSVTPVDWIVGTTSVGFQSYLRDTSTEARRLSDHFLIKATATLPRERSLKRCLQAPHDSSAVFCPPSGR